MTETCILAYRIVVFLVCAAQVIGFGFIVYEIWIKK